MTVDLQAGGETFVSEKVALALRKTVQGMVCACPQEPVPVTRDGQVRLINPFC